MMSFEPVFNELSLQYPAPSIAEACRRMSQFIETLVIATGTYHITRTLRVKDANFDYSDLAPGYSLLQWRNDRQVEREERDFFRLLQTKQPYLVEYADKQDAALTTDCLWHNTPAVGFQTALLLDTLAISVPTDAAWDAAQVAVTVQEFVGDTNDSNDADDNIQLIERTEQIHHASSRIHLHELAQWIAQRKKIDDTLTFTAIQTSDDLWEKRHTLFPSLEFCAIVEEHLTKKPLDKDRLDAIMRKLSYLEHYGSVWCTQKGDFNVRQLVGDASPESEPTLNKYSAERTFLCPDGTSRVFNWHMKLFGGWRIHFYPDNEQQTITIGYIGKHLRTARS